jgi:DNA-binding transcriptional ArsR family regulator
MKERRGLTELDDLETVFKALAHATRRRILVVVNARGGRMGAGAIAARFSCAWPTVSRHLRILEESGVLKVDRQGREWLYVLDYERLDKVVGGWLGWFGPKGEVGSDEQS